MMVGEQINLFERIEADERKSAEIKKMQDSYRMWKGIPEIVPLKNEYLDLHCVFSCSPIHVCKDKPQDVKIWWNVGASRNNEEYWVLSKKALCGEVIKNCPYCNADLAKGFGERFVQKWDRGNTFYQEKSVRAYYGLDEIDKEDEKNV